MAAPAACKRRRCWRAGSPVLSRGAVAAQRAWKGGSERRAGAAAGALSVFHTTGFTGVMERDGWMKKREGGRDRLRKKGREREG